MPALPPRSSNGTEGPAAVALGGTARVTHDFDVLATDGYLL